MLKVCKNTACECYEPIKEQYGQLPGVPSFAIVGLRRQAANTLRGAGLQQFLSVSCNGGLLLSLKRFDSGLPEPTTLCPPIRTTHKKYGIPPNDKEAWPEYRLGWTYRAGCRMDVVERRFVVTAVLSFAVLIATVAWSLIN
jgi:hypothetical protein